MFNQTVSLKDARTLPVWKRPITLLVLMSVAMPLAFSTWTALLNNFAHDVVGFNGKDIGWLQSVREIPGFLSFLVIFVLIVVREQILALVSLLLLGMAVTVTAWFPSFQGLLLTTFLGSIGFHYYEAVRQSVELQWLDKAKAPRILGALVAVGSAASLVAYGTIVLVWKTLGWDYNNIYLVGGGLTIVISFYCILVFPTIQSPVVQRKRIILRKRYWLYYTLQFMAGARRQIFLVFAAFMMVQKFGFEVHEVTSLFLINYIANIFFAPLMGRMVENVGERNALAFEYFGLVCVFMAYGGVFWFGWGATIAAALYVLDHLFFALAFAQKTYFQKIADPADIAPTAAVAFTINHIGAVCLPAALGYVWFISPPAVFVFAAIISVISFFLALCIPREPCEGHETIFSRQ